jgi:hypothetical protein
LLTEVLLLYAVDVFGVWTFGGVLAAKPGRVAVRRTNVCVEGKDVSWR